MHSMVCDEAQAAECGSSALMEVRVLGLYLLTVNGINGTLPGHYVNATEAGESVVLGRTAGAAPSLQVAPTRGYFVAYANDMGNIALHFIPEFDDAQESYVDYPDAGVIVDAGHADGDSGRCTDLGDAAAGPMDAGVDDASAPGHHYMAPAIATPSSGSIMTTSASGPANYASIALRGQVGSDFELGVTWVQGCGQASSSVWFSKATYNGVSNTFTSTTPVQVSPMGTRADVPSITYVDSGFARPGSTLMNGTHVDHDGGYYVVYIDRTASQNRALVRRVVGQDGSLLPELPIDVTDGSAMGLLASPRLYTMGTSAGPEPVGIVYGSTSGAHGAIAGQLVCTQPQ
jgi:hypothetical protein